MPRTYDMTKRAHAAAQTTERIVDATERLLATTPLPEVTLQAIADGAGVTVQTVLRHMGSRDGCFHAVSERVRQRIDAQRGASTPGDVDAAIAGLIQHYEADGRLVLNLLAQEAGQDDLARDAVRRGRDYHRAWVERCFEPLLPRTLGNDGASALDAELVDGLVAATDLYVWKLLRLDLGRSAAETRATIARTVRALLEAS
jgi:AcrR family transcriptional regulator